MLKRCGACDSVKPISEFHANRTKADGHATQCKACVGRRTAEWVAANPDRVKAYRKTYYAETAEAQRKRARDWRIANLPQAKASAAAWRDKNKNAVKASKRLASTGFTQDLFDTCLQLQNGKCAVCGILLAELPPRQVHADHCHASGAPRGILCHHCNTALGHLKDSIAVFEAAIRYLRNPPLRSSTA